MSPCTNRFLRFCFYIPIIVDFIKKVVASRATIPPAPLDLLKFYNFASPFVRTLRNAAHASHCAGFRNLCFFTHKISRRAWRFFYQTVIDSFNRSAIITLVSYCHIRRIHCFVVFRRMMILKPGCISVSVLFSKMTLTSTG